MATLTANENLQELAPHDLPILRDLRYDGSGFGVPMAEFPSEDQKLLRFLYEGVQGFAVDWRAHQKRPNPARITERLRFFGSDEYLNAAQRLGAATVAQGGRSMLRKIIHDVRGGGLMVLVGTSQMIRMGYPQAQTEHTCFNLARDHAKIMRNALVDLDKPVRDADETTKPHGIGHFIDKWTDTQIQFGDRPVIVRVHCDFHGDISARCLETSAIDRILYNYMNNAIRFTADGQVELSILHVAPHLIRWVVSNRITAKDQNWLDLHVGRDLRTLFRGGLTNGGNGIGLSSCADFLAASFGLQTPQEAVEEGYLGARVVENRYHAWFHWPVYAAESVQ